jgi:hypothetical protein
MELGDTSPEFPFLSDEEYLYFLGKHDWNVQKATLNAATAILFKLSMQGDDTVDIFSIKGSSAARQYIAALKLYVSNPSLNSSLQLIRGYAGGISKNDMQQNDNNTDNNTLNHTQGLHSFNNNNSFGF